MSLQLKRLNKNDETFRVNLNVIKRNNELEVTINDGSFNIQRMRFTSPDDFGTICESQVVVPATAQGGWPTPNQIIGPDGKVHLFFWGISNPNFIHHWVWQPQILVL